MFLFKPKQFLFILLLAYPLYQYSQNDSLKQLKDPIFGIEAMLGVLSPPNNNYVKHGLQSNLRLQIAWDHPASTGSWEAAPRTGIDFAFSDFGNNDSLGRAYTLLPFIEFKVLKKQDLHLQFGMGASYFTKKYDSLLNPNNQGVSTDIAYTFKAFLYKDIFKRRLVDWRLGLGYIHHSNGHIRLPNQGMNSFFLSISSIFRNTDKILTPRQDVLKGTTPSHKGAYYSLRFGHGKHVLSPAFNDAKAVISLSAETGKTINQTYKLGLGFHARYYRHYFDYIKNNEQLVQEGQEFEAFKKHPTMRALNFGFYAKAEVLLNHVGIEGQLGFNLYKPAYKIAWRITEGWSYLPRSFPDHAVLGEFNTKYKLKKLIYTRLGLKYYIIKPRHKPLHNMYLAFHINANFGQADFSELSIGYVKTFKLKQ